MNNTPATCDERIVTRHNEVMMYPDADVARFTKQGTGRDSESGFTLVEVVIALAILALALSVLLGTLSNGVRQSDSARRLVEGGQLAQSLLARLGTDMPIVPGQTSGEFPEGFRWRVRAEPYGDNAAPVAAYTLSVEVRWGDAANERSVALTTLRLAPKETTR